MKLIHPWQDRLGKNRAKKQVTSYQECKKRLHSRPRKHKRVNMVRTHTGLQIHIPQVRGNVAHTWKPQAMETHTGWISNTELCHSPVCFKEVEFTGKHLQNDLWAATVSLANSTKRLMNKYHQLTQLLLGNKAEATCPTDFMRPAPQGYQEKDRPVFFPNTGTKVFNKT